MDRVEFGHKSQRGVETASFEIHRCLDKGKSHLGAGACVALEFLHFHELTAKEIESYFGKYEHKPRNTAKREIKSLKFTTLAKEDGDSQ